MFSKNKAVLVIAAAGTAAQQAPAPAMASWFGSSSSSSSSTSNSVAVDDKGLAIGTHEKVPRHPESRVSYVVNEHVDEFRGHSMDKVAENFAKNPWPIPPND